MRLEPRPGLIYVGPCIGSGLFAVVQNTGRSVDLSQMKSYKKY